MLAAVAAGRDIILEGPPGTSKSTLLRAITAEWGIPLVFVEGNADLTPSKLIGHHNPARVLREDYSPDNFVDGPLLQAMRAGGFLYIEEFNRAPEDTLNTLLTAMAERQIAVPTAGIVTAAPTFRVVASMNPYDNVGTTRLSTSVHDRICRLAIGYQDAAAERGIVALRAPLPSSSPPSCTSGWSRTRWRSPGPPASTRTSGRAAACAAPSTSPWWRASCSSCAACAEGLPGAGVRRDGGRAVRADLPGRDRRGDAGGGAAADLGGPVHPGPGRGGAWLKSGAGRLAGAAAGTGAGGAAGAAAAAAQAARRGAAAARGVPRRGRGPGPDR